MALLGPRALDIEVSTADFCLILGYLCSPGRIGLIEAQIPEEKAFMFEREFPDEEYLLYNSRRNNWWIFDEKKLSTSYLFQ